MTISTERLEFFDNPHSDIGQRMVTWAECQEMARELLARREAEDWRDVRQFPPPTIAGTVVDFWCSEPELPHYPHGFRIPNCEYKSGPDWGAWVDENNMTVFMSSITHWRPLPAPPEENKANQSRPSQLEQKAIAALLKCASATYFAMEDSEEEVDAEGRTAIEKDHAANICAALDDLDDLPDDQPGFVMSGVAKAEWALRALLPAQPEVKS